MCLDFVRAIFNTPVWLQAGYYLATAAQIPAEKKKGCLSAPRNTRRLDIRKLVVVLTCKSHDPANLAEFV
jgi:hypothetical protein